MLYENQGPSAQPDKKNEHEEVSNATRIEQKLGFTYEDVAFDWTPEELATITEDAKAMLPRPDAEKGEVFTPVRRSKVARQIYLGSAALLPRVNAASDVEMPLQPFYEDPVTHELSKVDPALLIPEALDAIGEVAGANNEAAYLHNRRKVAQAYNTRLKSGLEGVCNSTVLETAELETAEVPSKTNLFEMGYEDVVSMSSPVAQVSGPEHTRAHEIAEQLDIEVPNGLDMDLMDEVGLGGLSIAKAHYEAARSIAEMYKTLTTEQREKVKPKVLQLLNAKVRMSPDGEPVSLNGVAKILARAATTELKASNLQHREEQHQLAQARADQERREIQAAALGGDPLYPEKPLESIGIESTNVEPRVAEVTASINSEGFSKRLARSVRRPVKEAMTTPFAKYVVDKAVSLTEGQIAETASRAFAADAKLERAQTGDEGADEKTVTAFEIYTRKMNQAQEALGGIQYLLEDIDELPDDMNAQQEFLMRHPAYEKYINIVNFAEALVGDFDDPQQWANAAAIAVSTLSGAAVSGLESKQLGIREHEKLNDVLAARVINEHMDELSRSSQRALADDILKAERAKRALSAVTARLVGETRVPNRIDYSDKPRTRAISYSPAENATKTELVWAAANIENLTSSL